MSPLINNWFQFRVWLSIHKFVVPITDLLLEQRKCGSSDTFFCFQRKTNCALKDLWFQSKKLQSRICGSGKFVVLLTDYWLYRQILISSWRIEVLVNGFVVVEANLLLLLSKAFAFTNLLPFWKHFLKDLSGLFPFKFALDNFPIFPSISIFAQSHGSELLIYFWNFFDLGSKCEFPILCKFTFKLEFNVFLCGIL